MFIHEEHSTDMDIVTATEKPKDQLEEFSFTDKSYLEKDLVCNICNKTLNVPPVFYNDNIGSICGRCSSAATMKGLGAIMRQQAYEDLISYLTFPCTNKVYGCMDVLKFDQVLPHEKSCRYQCISCPLSYKQLFSEKSCSWTGNSKLFADHLKTHTDEFLDPPQLVWPEEKNMIFFSTVGSQIVTIVIKYEDANKYTCLVMSNGTDLESQCFRYQLELANEDKSKSMILRMNRLEPLAEFPENLRMPEKVLEVDMTWVLKMLQNPLEVHARFGVVKKHKKEIMQIAGALDGELPSGLTIGLGKEKNVGGASPHAPPDDEMLAELECPVCNEYMVPPIFICATGHSVCSDCKTKVATCPSCRCSYADGRNFTLEKLTTKVKYPCRNREIGCGFVTTSDKIKLHHSSCELSENSCVLKCGWKGLFPAMYNHFLDKHSNQLIEHNTPILKDVKQDKLIGHYFLYVMGELFCLNYRNCNKFTVKFSIQHVGHVEQDPKYKYSIQFFSSPNDMCPNLTLTSYCQTWNDNLADALNSNYVTVPGDLIKSYSFQNHLYYFKINITKV